MPMSNPNPKPASMPDKKRERHMNDQFSGKPELATVRRVDGLAKVAASASGLLKKINCGNTPCIVMLSMPKKNNEMRTIGGPKGVLKVLEVEPTGMCSRVAQPSGLLNDLNPEIMNRMRSRKQLFSVIQALVRRDAIGNVDILSRQEKRFGGNDVNECPNGSSGSDQLELCSKAPSSLLCVKTEYEEEIDDLGIAVRRADDEDDKDDMLPQHLKGCNVFAMTSQGILKTQLPALMLKEFSVDHETEFFAAKSAVSMNQCP
ncbi:hypothetical protein H0E87_030233 [Populus deltoides]|uniref:Uncharacterized protein n=1 Tax=Populus deltoides TaxID=3696 RepID=A0A8T2WGF7_POPDE|nr:hypothetical protein H0E87_030233 [Populus deltoides]